MQVGGERAGGMNRGFIAEALACHEANTPPYRSGERCGLLSSSPSFPPPLLAPSSKT